MSETIFEQKEIEEMFNTSFLPMVQKFAERTMKNRPEENIKMFRILLDFNFLPQSETLQFKDIEKAIQMQLQPITQEDIDEWEKIQNSKLPEGEIQNENAKVPFEKV